MRFRNPADIASEIEEIHKKHNINTFYFWESNLLINSKNHFEIILDNIIDKKIDIEISTPEGLQPNLINLNLAKKMKKAGFKKVHLPLESSDDQISKNRFKRVSTLNDFRNAANHLLEAGFEPKNIIVFILAGLAKQKISSIIDSLVEVIKLGLKIKIMPFTPIPGTEEYNKHKKLLKGKKLHELHPFLFPLANQELKVEEMIELCCFNTDLYSPFDVIKWLPEESRVRKQLAAKLQKEPKAWENYYNEKNNAVSWDNAGLPDYTIIKALREKFIDKENEKRILDVGCGKGKNSIFLQNEGFGVHGIDIAENAISNLKKISINNFTSGDIMKYKPKCKFDAIIDIGCFHFIPDKKRYIKKIRSLLNKGGKYILRSFSEYGYYTKRFYCYDTKEVFKSPFVSYMTKKEIFKIIGEHFEIIKSADLFWTIKKHKGKYVMVPGMYEFYLEKKNP